MTHINLVYIDDNPDISLSKYLDNDLHLENSEIAYSEIQFSPIDGYEKLLKDPRVSTANIIIIDSLLFENKEATYGKFSGEEFKVILRKYYPFIEVIVITQNEPETAAGTLSKYDSSKHGLDSRSYYNAFLPATIKAAAKRIEEYLFMAQKAQSNECLNPLLVEKIENSLAGITTYDELTKADVDRLIEAINNIQ